MYYNAWQGNLQGQNQIVKNPFGRV